MRLVVISGLSGSGKSVALHTLEDGGFYCIDNLPAGLLPTLAAQLTRGAQPSFQSIAVGVDARNLPAELIQFPEILGELSGMGIRPELVFLEADDSTLLKRFSETRRRHPLSEPNVSLSEAIQRERQLLQSIAEYADLHVDTSHTNVHQLRDLIHERIERRSKALSLLLQSFGFKHGVPMDADFVFDVRCLPNPNWEPALRALTGLDAQVVSFLCAQPTVTEMLEDLNGFLSTWIPHFEADNRSYLTVAVGCTGGQHRSVYLVSELVKRFRDRVPNIQVRHRELQ